MPDVLARTLFPQILQKYMNRDHLNQVYIAKHLHVSKQTVSDWCNGKKFPSVDKMQALSDLFGVLMSDMYTPNSEKTNARLDPDELRLISAWRSANPIAQRIALQALENTPQNEEHSPKKDTESTAI